MRSRAKQGKRSKRGQPADGCDRQNPPESQGGKGGVPEVPRSVFNAITASVKAGWPITDEDKIKLIEVCSATIHGKAAVRTKLAAGKLLLAANAQNLKASEVLSKSSYLQAKMRQAEKALPPSDGARDVYNVQIRQIIAQVLPELKGLTFEQLKALEERFASRPAANGEPGRGPLPVAGHPGGAPDPGGNGEAGGVLPPGVAGS